MRRVIVTGSRDWQERPTVWMALHSEAIRAFSDAAMNGGETFTVVHGKCRTGADLFAARWCAAALRWEPLKIVEEPHPADWETYGKRAGFKRNAEMVDLGADICLAFIRNGSRGASHTAALAEAAGIPTQRFVE